MQKKHDMLWYNNDAVEPLTFMQTHFPAVRLERYFRRPSDFPGGKAGDVLQRVIVCGVPCIGLNGGDVFKQAKRFPSNCYR
jgi:predicted 3-demethylubiquinone-9 3-methyltransferase (glyoxalase superfamily)